MTYIDEKSKNPITIVSKKIKGMHHIGVARCGSLEEFSPTLGVEIAQRRAEIQPWAVIKDLSHYSFIKFIVPTILSNMANMKQSNLQNIRRL